MLINSGKLKDWINNDNNLNYTAFGVECIGKKELLQKISELEKESKK